MEIIQNKTIKIVAIAILVVMLMSMTMPVFAASTKSTNNATNFFTAIWEFLSGVFNAILKGITSAFAKTPQTGTVNNSLSGVYKITAYCPCVKCCGKTDGITASGAKATAGRTIAAPKSFAFGTKVIINGKTYVVEDRGGAIKGNRIDIYMNTHQEALNWGVKNLEITVLDK